MNDVYAYNLFPQGQGFSRAGTRSLELSVHITLSTFLFSKHERFSFENRHLKLFCILGKIYAKSRGFRA
jgi:hypothetical protein